MPVLSFDLEHDGRPIVDLYVSVSRAELEVCREEGRPITPSIAVRALIDTGTGRSHVDLGVLTRLSIAPVATGIVYTVSGSGPEPRNVYVVDLALAGERPGPIASDLPIFGSAIADDLRVGMLLGRDILGACVLSYDGIDRRFTLAYNPPPRGR